MRGKSHMDRPSQGQSHVMDAAEKLHMRVKGRLKKPGVVPLDDVKLSDIEHGPVVQKILQGIYFIQTYRFK